MNSLLITFKSIVYLTVIYKILNICLKKFWATYIIRELKHLTVSDNQNIESIYKIYFYLGILSHLDYSKYLALLDGLDERLLLPISDFESAWWYLHEIHEMHEIHKHGNQKTDSYNADIQINIHFNLGQLCIYDQSWSLLSDLMWFWFDQIGSHYRPGADCDWNLAWQLVVLRSGYFHYKPKS